MVNISDVVSHNSYNKDSFRVVAHRKARNQREIHMLGNGM